MAGTVSCSLSLCASVVSAEGAGLGLGYAGALVHDFGWIGRAGAFAVIAAGLWRGVWAGELLLWGW